MYCGHSVDMDQRGECGMFQIDWNSFANYNQTEYRVSIEVL